MIKCNKKYDSIGKYCSVFGAKSHLLGLESHSYLEFGHALVKEEATNLDI